MLLRWSLHNISGSSRSALSLWPSFFCVILIIFDNCKRKQKKAAYCVSQFYLIWKPTEWQCLRVGWRVAPYPPLLQTPLTHPQPGDHLWFKIKWHGLSSFFRGLWVLARTLLSLLTPYLRRLPVLRLPQGEILKWEKGLLPVSRGGNQQIFRNSEVDFSGREKTRERAKLLHPSPLRWLINNPPSLTYTYDMSFSGVSWFSNFHEKGFSGHSKVVFWAPHISWVNVSRSIFRAVKSVQEKESVSSHGHAR